MIRFNNDYSQGAHPAVIRALTAANTDSFGGYGLDPWCEKAAGMIREHLDRPGAAVHFVVGGTQANYIAVAACLRAYESVVCADSGHIHAHETGAVEHGGHKILVLPGENGKLTAGRLAAVGESYRQSPIPEHITRPALAYISFPTEYGTVYTRDELAAIRAVCDEYGMYLYVDGARMGYGLAASDVTLADMARYADIFTIGGTKCGALFGEAVVVTAPALQPFFRSFIKQNGAMLAKGWLLGLQFAALFENGVYFDICRRAVELAGEIRAAFAGKGIPAFLDSPTNQQFVVLTNAQAEKLAEKYVFEPDHAVDGAHVCVRFCTSWYTDPADVAALVKDIKAL